MPYCEFILYKGDLTFASIRDGYFYYLLEDNDIIFFKSYLHKVWSDERAMIFVYIFRLIFIEYCSYVSQMKTLFCELGA